jgi:hypothetical protein
MEFLVPINIPDLPEPIQYGEKIFLTGSCFTEHIGNRLSESKFNTLLNSNGILFDPHSVASSLVSYIQPRIYTEADLFHLNELWQSWQHHGIFSALNPGDCLHKINHSQQRAHEFLGSAKWLIITLGSAFSYRLTEQVPVSQRSGGTREVANCHRAPASWFEKHLMTIDEIKTELDNCLHQLLNFNPGLRVLFTISPVRHIRDGVIENNRSKARLIEAVHYMVRKFEGVFYFPAYELVIDVLRDYRFYDADLVHPNYAATGFVMEKFMLHCVSGQARSLSEEIRKLAIARKHKPFQPSTIAHRQFLETHFEKTKRLKVQYPFLDLEEELEYFSNPDTHR